MILLAAACTEYDFSKGADHAGAPDERPEDVLYPDTGAPTDTGEPPPIDSGEVTPEEDSAPEQDSAPAEDACWEPEDGYEQNPAARLIVTDNAEKMTVTFVETSTAYTNTLFLDSPDSIQIVRAWADPIGTGARIGPYPVGTEVVFGIDVSDTGQHWRSGPATRNSDGVVHVAMTYEGGCSWLIGFEDMTGGGDLDYNDVVLRITGMLRQED